MNVVNGEWRWNNNATDGAVVSCCLEDKNPRVMMVEELYEMAAAMMGGITTLGCLNSRVSD